MGPSENEAANRRSWTGDLADPFCSDSPLSRLFFQVVDPGRLEGCRADFFGKCFEQWIHRLSFELPMPGLMLDQDLGNFLLCFGVIRNRDASLLGRRFDQGPESLEWNHRFGNGQRSLTFPIGRRLTAWRRPRSDRPVN